MQLEFRSLLPTDDIATVADLILSTDPFIYKDLFGSRENAIKVLPLLLKKGKGIFKYNSYYVAVCRNRIAGLAALYKIGDLWDTESAKIAFMEADVEIPPSFDEVCEYFTSAHNYTPETKACNVCVAPEFRGQGIGDYMVKQLINTAGKSDITLTVLATNMAAINLYQKNGFKILYDFDDYGGYKRPKAKCYCMIRQNKN